MVDYPLLRLKTSQTFDEIVKTYESKVGKPLDVIRLSSEEIKKKQEAGDLLGILYSDWENGNGVIGEPDNDLYPGWNPKKVIDAIA